MDADRYCVTPEGAIVLWSHEEPDDPEPVQESFSELLLRELRELEERLDRRRRSAS